MASSTLKCDEHVEEGRLLSTMGEKEKMAETQSKVDLSRTTMDPRELASTSRAGRLSGRTCLLVVICLIFVAGLASVPTPRNCLDEDRKISHGGIPKNTEHSKLSTFWRTGSFWTVDGLTNKPSSGSLPQDAQETSPDLAKEPVEIQAQQVEVIQTTLKLVRRQDEGSNSTTTPSSTSTTSESSTTSSTTVITTSSSTTIETTTSTESTTSSSESSSTPSSTSTTGSTTTTTSSASSTSTTSTSSTKESTTVKATSSSPVPHTLTTTLAGGRATTITSTSWLVIQPSAQSTTSEPELQDDAAALRGHITIAVAVALTASLLILA